MPEQTEQNQEYDIPVGMTLDNDLELIKITFSKLENATTDFHKQVILLNLVMKIRTKQIEELMK